MVLVKSISGGISWILMGVMIVVFGVALPSLSAVPLSTVDYTTGIAIITGSVLVTIVGLGIILMGTYRVRHR